MTNAHSDTYTYDADGNILKVDNGNTAQYVYNALNQRVRATVGSAVSEYLYDTSGRRTSTWSLPADTATEGRIYADGRQLAYRASDGTTYFDQQDYLGTERMRTSSTGAVAATYTSLPWGDGYSANVSKAAGDQDSSHFAGLDQDLNSAGAAMSEHAQFRNYSFQQGRWLSPDPYDGSYDESNPQSLNRYAYVLNNPLSYNDPLGLDVVECPPGTADDISICINTSSGSGGGWGGPGNYPCLDYLTYYNCDGGNNGNGNSGNTASGGSSSAAPTPSLGPPHLAPSNGQPPARKYPKTTLPGTNFCGPGAYGPDFNNLPTLNGTDEACRQHDVCYGNANANALTTLNPFRQGATLSCDAQLCTAMSLVTPTSYTENADRQFISFLFGCQ